MRRNLIIIILLLAFVAVVVFLDYPLYKEVKSFRKGLEIKQEELRGVEELLVKIKELKAIYEENKDEAKRAFYAIPSGEDLPNLIVQLEALASINGLILEKVDFGQPAAEGVKWGPGGEEKEIVVKEYKTMNVTLEVTGTYESLKSFLKSVEENIRLMDITSINFSASAEGGAFSFGVSMNVYYQ